MVFFACGVFLMSVLAGPALLPAAALEGGEAHLTYRAIPFRSFTLVDGRLSATWPEEYRVSECALVADNAVVTAYTPGATIPFVPSGGTQHYDFVLRVRSGGQGSTFLAVTPVACFGSSHDVPAPFEACYGGRTGTCTMVSTADACGESVSCSGASTTCHDCGSDREACCTSASGPRANELTFVTRRKACAGPAPRAESRR